MTEPEPPAAAAASIPPAPGADPAALRRAKLGKLRGRLGALGVLSALVAVAMAGGAVYAARQGSLSYRVAHDILFALAAPAVALLAVVLGALTLVIALIATPRRGFRRALFAIVLGAATVWAATRLGVQPADAPPVHEVATDWRDPLMPSAKLVALRGAEANPIVEAPSLSEGPTPGGFLGRLVAEVNAKTCPAAVPATVLGSPDAAYAKAKTALLDQKLTLVTDDPASGRLEATGERGLFALKDDVIVRIRPEGAGARIDLRSTAREGATDGGANCARLGKLRAAVAS